MTGPPPSMQATRIGALVLPNPFFMAPMAGVTDSIVRRMARRHLCGLVTTEMVSAHLLVQRGADACLGRMTYQADERPISIQIFGADAAVLVEAARRVEAAGADIVDINLGCSVPKVARVGGGAALCRNPHEVARILRDVVAAVGIPVTVKIRKGWDELRISAFEILRVAEDAGVSALCIHARTSRQAYGGRADWPFIGEMVSRARIPIIGNGDIFTAGDALRMLETTGCSAVMIGRASRGNPWIFRECVALRESGVLPAPASWDERLALAEEHLEALAEKDGGRVVQFRKFLGWYVRGLPNATDFRDRVFHLDDVAAMREALRAFMDEARATLAAMDPALREAAYPRAPAVVDLPAQGA